MNEPLLEPIPAPDNRQSAGKRVKRNKGAAGVDGLDIVDYPQGARQRRSGIRRALAAGYYIPQPVNRVAIPKASGGKRLLGIPTVNDRLIQPAITQVVTPIFDPGFSLHSAVSGRTGQRSKRYSGCVALSGKVAVRRWLLIRRSFSTTSITIY